MQDRNFGVEAGLEPAQRLAELFETSLYESLRSDPERWERLQRKVVPITIDENQCADCHVDAELVGTTVEEGEATPAPASHFTDLRRAADKVTAELIGARFLCTQCHATQADAKPLVENTFE